MVALVIEDKASEELIAIGGSLEQLLKQSIALNDATQILVDEIKKEVRASFSSRTGALERSWEVRQETEGGRQLPVAASDLPYARIQNEGGTILPLVSKNLAIPLPGSGVQRGQGPRQYAGDLRWRPSKKADTSLLVDMSKKGRDGKPGLPVFVLKKRVRLSGTGYLFRAIDKAGPLIADRLDSDIQRVVDAGL